MKLSSKVRNSISIIRILGDGQVKKGHELTSKLDISEPYLEQIMQPLVARGVISTKRGCKGGYFLSADLDVLSVYELDLMFSQEECSENEMQILIDDFLKNITVGMLCS